MLTAKRSRPLTLPLLARSGAAERTRKLNAMGYLRTLQLVLQPSLTDLNVRERLKTAIAQLKGEARGAERPSAGASYLPVDHTVSSMDL
eukprot:m.156175 g.156175  ORF g.156175 m.156175 type:complete len:89 (+) comp17555_c0_seq2:2036-2302(+)